MRTSILALALLISSTLFVESALACNDAQVDGEVLGVGPDGGWVYLVRASGGGGETSSSFLTRYAPDGKVIARLEACTGRPCDDTCAFEPGEPDPCDGQLLVPFLGESATQERGTFLRKGVLERIKRHLKLTPVRKGTARLHTETDDTGDNPFCTMVSASSRDGRLDLMGLTRDMTDLRCPQVEATLYENTHAAFRFIRLKHGLIADCGIERDSFVWFPKDRFETMRRFARAQKLPLVERAKSLREVVLAEPGYVPARIALARALYDSKVPWTTAVAMMSVPATVSFWAGQRSDLSDALASDAFSDWEDEPIGDWIETMPEFWDESKHEY